MSLISQSLRYAFAMAISLSASVASSQSIEIKGLSIGMSKAEVLQKYPDWSGFTIAEVEGKYASAPLIVEYREEKLDYLLFLFHSSDFPNVSAAVKDKYPRLSCKESPVGNALGATFIQTECAIEDSKSILHLSRFVNDIKTSSLTLISRKKNSEMEGQSKQKRKDI